MKKNRRQRITMIVALALVFMLLAGIVSMAILAFMPPAQAVTQAEINRLKQNKASLQAEKKKIQEEINAIKGDTSKAVEEKIAIDKQISIINDEVETTTQLISELNLTIAEQQEELDKTITEEAAAYERFLVRLRVMEETDTGTYLSIIFGSGSFSDILDRWDIINEIIKSDEKLMDDLAAKRESIEEQKSRLEADKADMNDYRRELSERQSELAVQYAESDKIIRKLQMEQAAAEEAYQKQLAAEEAAAKEIAAAEAELKRQLEAAKKTTQYVGGKYLWPVPGHNRITSGYGMRLHPILKTNKFHKGIDIGAPSGANVVAANSGTIIVATYNSSYGNYMVVDHGGGQMTLYAHLSRFASGMKVNKTVNRGDTIAHIGSTGLSTGPHLHFEIRINGSTTDPEPYLKG